MHMYRITHGVCVVSLFKLHVKVKLVILLRCTGYKFCLSSQICYVTKVTMGCKTNISNSSIRVVTIKLIQKDLVWSGKKYFPETCNQWVREKKT